MEEMHVKCPHCGNEMNVTLRGKKSSLVVCVCGRCKSPLITLDGEVFELDHEEFHSLRKKLTRVVDALRESAETHQDILTPLLEKVHSEHEKTANQIEKKESSVDKISKEDLDNLRIDLETCKDVEDFIDKL